MRGLGRLGGWVLLLALALSLGSVRAWAQGAQRINYGETVESTIAEDDQRWVFTGAVGDVVLIDMVAAEDSQLDPLLSLLDSAGAVLVTDDDGGVGLNARIGPYVLPASGEYTIVASRYNGTGSYRLSLHTLNTAPLLRMGKPLRGAVSNDTPREYYRLQAEAEEPQLVRLLVTGEGDLGGPKLVVYGPAGHPIVADMDAPNVLDPLLLLPQTRYIVEVGQTEEGVGGAYTITVAPADASLLQDGVPQRAQLTASMYARRHYFIGQAGDVVQVTLEAEEGFLPALYVQQQGKDDVLFSGDGGAVNRFSATLTLPADGAYVVGIFEGQFAQAEAHYTLTVSWQAR